MGLTTRKTQPIGNGPVLPTKTQHFNITTLPPNEYLSSDRIMTWSVCRLCSSSHFSTSPSQVCYPTNIGWAAIENPLISLKICPFFTATQPISVGWQIGKQEEKERPELHNLLTEHVTIRWDLKYLIRGKDGGTVKLEPRPGSNLAGNLQVHVRSGLQTLQNKTGCNFGLVWNRTEPNRQPKTGPLAGHQDLLLTLAGGK